MDAGYNSEAVDKNTTATNFYLYASDLRSSQTGKNDQASLKSHPNFSQKAYTCDV